MKERLTITVDKELLDKVDKIVDGVNIRNRSHAIEYLIRSALSESYPKQAIIFAGGESVNVGGVRSLKCLIQIRGHPIIEYIIRELKRNSIGEIILVIGTYGEKVIEALGDGSSFGVKIRYVRESRRAGTQGALVTAKELVSGDFFAMNGDQIFKFDMYEMYRQHVETKALATIALTTSAKTNKFGVIKLDGPRVVDFVEKPSEKEGSKLISAGIYLFNQAIFDTIGSDDGKIVMIEKDLFPRLAKMRGLFGFVFSGYWYSIDNEERIGEGMKNFERAVELIFH